MEPAMNHLNQLIKDYGDQVGLDELALPDHGSISLDFEDGIQIHLDQLDEKLVMYSQVGLVEEGNDLPQLGEDALVAVHVPGVEEAAVR